MNPTLVADDLYDRALAGEACWVRSSDGSRRALPIGRWMGFAGITDDDRRVDDELIDGCDGPTLDLGCGPGRLVGELVRRGVSALGIDVSATAVAVTRYRGAPALQRDMFDQVPGAGRWRYALLADGNIGIGGNPARLLDRVRNLMHTDGTAIVEFGARGTGFISSTFRLESNDGVGPWFPWAHVGVEYARPLAWVSSLRVLGSTEVAGRHIVRMGVM